MVWSRLFSAVAGIIAIVLAGSAFTPAHAADEHRKALPEHVFAPYFEAFLNDSPGALSRASGARFLTLAFLQTPAPGSCEIGWNGDPATPVAPSTFGADIARIRAAGGDVVPSFGGFGADHGGTEIADSCSSVPAIAAAYEKVITTYDVTRLDMDIEDNSQTNAAGVDRRNKAIAMVERWAREHHRTIQFVFTIPTNVHGLDPAGVAVLQNAAANHARVDVVNIMTFDYFDNQPHEMAQDTMTAADALIATLRQIHPHASTRQLWSTVGVTEMVGIDDFGPPEVFTPADATTVLHWARSRGIAELSFWALQRDNGGCVGTAGSNTCSGVAQSTWQFSHTLEPFTRR